jgi:hypothetical protein
LNDAVAPKVAAIATVSFENFIFALSGYQKN